MIVSPETSRSRTREDLLDPTLAASLDRLDVLSRKVFAGKMPGERRSKRRGRSVEFDDYRVYAPGDDLRHIDWNVFARLDRFFIKLFREEEDLQVSVMLDTSASMAGGRGSSPGDGAPSGSSAAGIDGEAVPSKLLYGARLAMGLAYIGLVNRNRVTVGTFGGHRGGASGRLAPMRGRQNVERVAAYLRGEVERATVTSTGRAVGGERSFARAIAPFAERSAGRGVVLIISDMMFTEGIDAGVRTLAAAGAGGARSDAMILQTLSPGELDPRRERAVGLLGDLRLTDIESGRAAEVTISKEMLAAYERRLAEHLGMIGRACTTRGIRHAVVSTATPVGEVLTGTLRERRLVGAMGPQ